MTAEELLELIKEANSWNLNKVLRVFDNEGISSYLVKYGVDKFAEKVKNESGLTVNDLRIGDIITNGDLRYAVLGIDDLCGAYIFDGEQTAYIIDCDIEDFRKTGESVSYQLNKIMDVLAPTRF